MEACRFCSHSPCICDEYLVTLEEAEMWWQAFGRGARSIKPKDLRRLVVTVVSLHEKLQGTFGGDHNELVDDPEDIRMTVDSSSRMRR